MVAHDLRAGHRQGFSLGGVHLARHDRRARLVFRQQEFAEPRARAGAQQADVVGNLEERCCQCIEDAREFHQRVMGREGFELVGRRDERIAGDPRCFLGEAFSKAYGCIQSRADGGATLGQRVEARQGGYNPLDAELQLAGVAREFLAQRDGGCVLKVRASDLDDRCEIVGLACERTVQAAQARHQAAVDLEHGRDVHCGRKAVVRGLSAVHVVVGVHRLLRAHLAAEHLDGPVGDNLVGVHVGLCARACLPDDKREVVVELAVDHLVGGLADGVADLRVEVLQRHVGQGGGLLDNAEGMDERDGHAFAADAEVFDRTLGLCAPIAVGRNLNGAEGVGFGACLCHLSSCACRRGLFLAELVEADNGRP